MCEESVYASSITATTTQLNWTENGEASAWQIELMDGENNSVIIDADSNPFTLISLTPESTYAARVRAYCDEDNQSRWSEEIIFETFSACQTPDGLAAAATSNSAVISWNGYGQETFNLRYSTDGENWTTVTGVNNPYTLQQLVASTIYKVQVQPTCADEETWSAIYTFHTYCESITTFPWSEDFENGELSFCWDQEGNGTWTVGTGNNTTITGAHTSTYNAKITHGTTGNVTKLITPVLDLTSLNNPALTFWYINRKWVNDIDGFAVYYRTASNAEWTLIEATEEAHETWTRAAYLLPNKSATYQIAFEMTDGYGYGVGIDDVVIDETVPLYDNAANSTTISNNNVNPANVFLSGRTLWKDGHWNTLCLPFDVTLTGTLIEGATLMELDVEGKYTDTGVLDNTDGTYQTKLADDGTLYLYFKNADAISAGVPYIIKWDAATQHLVNPLFSGVTIDNSAEAQARQTVTFTGGKFVGTYDYMQFDDEDKSILLLGEEDALYWPISGASIGAFRAYFDLGSNGDAVREFRLNFGGEESTQGIISLTSYPSPKGEGSIYTLDGRKLDKLPTRKGLYIKNGRKVVIK